MSAVIASNSYVKTATILGLSAAPGLPAANVAGDQGSPSTGWQTAAGVVTSVGFAGALLQITPPVAALPWRAIGLFGTNLTPAATVLFQLWTTGFGSPNWSATVSPQAGYGQAVAIPPTDITADFLRVIINDAANPDGFINVPLCFAGPAWLPAGSTGFSSTVGRDESVAEVVTRGGQEYPTLLWQRRRWNIAFDSLRQSETWTQADPLFRTAKAGSNVFFCPDSGSANLQQEAIFGRLKGTSDISYPYGGADRRRWQATITERL